MLVIGRGMSCGVAMFVLTVFVGGCALPGVLWPFAPADDSVGDNAGCASEPNGCGPSGLLGVLVPECPLGLVCFTSACNHHDTCYSTCGTTRAACDDAFYADLKAICVANCAEGDARRTRCEWLAYIYWQAVVRFGEAYFAGAQAQACGCADRQARTGVASDPTSGPPPQCPFEDRDDDLLPDEWEERMGLNPDDPSDAMLDFDGDGCTNLREYVDHTDPWSAPEAATTRPE